MKEDNDGNQCDNEEGRKRMKMTTKAMVKMSAHPLQCFDISETKNDPDNSMNEETIT